jgi:uncharacterized cupin superfamily protein
VSDPVKVVTAATAELADEELEPGQVIAGDPRTSAFTLAEFPDGSESGVWRCTPGVLCDIEADETFVVLEGRATIEWDGGSVEVQSGDVCVLRAGTETVWTVHEPLLKGFAIAGRDASR